MSEKSRDDLIRERDESLRLNRGLLDAMPGGVVHVGAGGAIRYANAEALEVLGYTYDEITERYTSDWDPETVWEDGSPCRAEDYPVSKALMTGESQPAVTIGNRRPDGETRWCVYRAMPLQDGEGKVTGAVVTFFDITERKRIEDEQRASAALLQSILDHVPSLILKLDVEGRIEFVNRVAPGLAKDISPKDVVGQSVFSFINEDDHDMVRGLLHRVVETGGPAAYEVRGLEGFDPNLWSTQMGPVLSDDGDVVGILQVVTNETERIAADRERDDLRVRLAASQRLEAIGRLAGGVAHDFNNLLTVILGSVDMLTPNVAGTPLEPRFNSISEAANRAARLTRQLLAFSRQQELEPTHLEVDGVIDGVVEMLEHLLGEEIELVFQPGGVGFVFADVVQLERVIVNLATNARDAMRDGGRLEILTREDGDHIAIEVIDDGDGIDEETRRHMFEPFFTTKERGEGTGLGLATVHGIVKQSGGELEVASEEGNGTRFTIRLPRASRPEETDAVSPPDIAEGMTRARILLVEDADSVRGVVRQILLEEGYAVDDVASPLDVVARGEDACADYDLLLTDVVMPKMSGPELAVWVLERRPAIRVLFMSGYNEESIHAHGVDQDTVAFVSKPFTAEGLIGAVRAALSEQTDFRRNRE